VDYIYFMADGVVIAQGTPEEIRKSDTAFVHQFVHGEIDGPMAYHYPAPSYAEDMNMGAVHV
jgi:phospholipid/cholesterol/gamma-HCH transport system ATP-binding protein